MFDYLLRASAVVNDLSFTHLHEPPRPNTGNPVPRGTPAIRQVRRPHSCSTQNSGMIVPFAPGFGKRGILFIQPNVRVGGRVWSCVSGSSGLSCVLSGTERLRLRQKEALPPGRPSILRSFQMPGSEDMRQAESPQDSEAVK